MDGIHPDAKLGKMRACRHLVELGMDGVHHVLARPPGQDGVQRKVAAVLGQRAPVAAHHVQALGLAHLLPDRSAPPR